jgi:hypothetical protein
MRWCTMIIARSACYPLFRQMLPLGNVKASLWKKTTTLIHRELGWTEAEEIIPRLDRCEGLVLLAPRTNHFIILRPCSSPALDMTHYNPGYVTHSRLGISRGQLD